MPHRNRFLAVFNTLLPLAALLVACLAPATALAADLSGVVRDRDTLAPLSFTSVQLLGESRRTGTVTDAEGAFLFADLAPGIYELRFFYVGYENRRDTVAVADAPVVLDIALKGEGFAEEPVRVTAERITVTEEDVQPGLVSLDLKDVTDLPAVGEADPIRSLQLLPGVQAASDISSGLYVRGGGPDQTLILLDGVTLYNPTHAFGLFSTFNPDALGRVALYKGAYPAEYTGRLGSVLKVASREGNREAFRGKAAVSLISGKVAVDGPVGSGSWMVSGRRTYLEPVLNSLRTEDNQIPDYYFYDLNAGLTQNLANEDVLRVFGYLGRDRLLFDLGEDSRIEVDWGNRMAGASYTRFLRDQVFVTALVSGSEYESLTDVKIFSTPLAVENRVGELSARADLTAQVSESHRLRGGIQSTAYRLTYNQVFNDTPNLEFTNRPVDVTAYAEDRWQGESGATWRPGLRLRYFSEGRRWLWEPRVSASRPLSRRVTATVGAGLYHQVLQLVATEGFAAGDFYFPVDRTTEPSRSWQVVTGLTWNPSEHYRVKGEAYYTGLDRLLILDNRTPAEPRADTDGLFLTGGTGYATGVELFAEKRTGRLRGWLGYTLGWTRRTFAELNEGKPFPPKYDRRHDVSAVATYDTGPWTFSSAFVLGTGQAFTSGSARYRLSDPASGERDPGGFVLPSARNGDRLLPYHRLDAGVARDFDLFGLDAQWTVQVFNVYSRRNEWFVQFDSEDPENPPEIVRQLPIIPSAGVRFAF